MAIILMLIKINVKSAIKYVLLAKETQNIAHHVIVEDTMMEQIPVIYVINSIQ